MTTTDYDYMRSGEIVDGALPKASFVFDIDRTLVDSVYQHVLAWRTALESEGINLSAWRIHRKIGMSGGLFTNMLLPETGCHIDSARIERLRRLHATEFNHYASEIQPLPGARDLLSFLTQAQIPWAIATSGSRTAENTIGIDACAVLTAPVDGDPPGRKQNGYSQFYEISRKRRQLVIIPVRP